MFISAARAVAGQLSDDQIHSGLLYPPQRNILETEITTAQRIAELIFDRGLAGVKRPKNVRSFLESQLYTPQYASLVEAK